MNNPQQALDTIAEHLKRLDEIERILLNHYQYYAISLNELKVAEMSNSEYLILLGAYLALNNQLCTKEQANKRRYLNTDIPEALKDLINKHFGVKIELLSNPLAMENQIFD